MANIFNLLLAAIGGVLCIAALNPIMGQNYLRALLLASIGAGMIFCAFSLEKTRKNRQNQNKDKEYAKRMMEIIQAYKNTDKKIKINDITNKVSIIITIAYLSFLTYINSLDANTHQNPMPATEWLLANIIISLPLCASIFSAHRWGKPCCELDHNGITLPSYGMIPWASIEGLNFNCGRSRRGEKTYSLSLKINLPQLNLKNFHWTQYLLARCHMGVFHQGIIALAFVKPTEPPEVIYAVAKFLWKSTTGHDYDWDPRTSHETLQARQRISTRSAHIEHLLSTLTKLTPQNYTQENTGTIEKTLDNLSRKYEKNRKDRDIIYEEHQKNIIKLKTRLRQAILAALLFIILTFFWWIRKTGI